MVMPTERGATVIADHHHWSSVLALWVTWAHSAGHSSLTIRLRLHYLAILAAAYPKRLPEALDGDDLAAVIGRPGWAPETRKSARAAIRSFYGWMHGSGRVGTDPSATLPRIRVPRAQPRPVPIATFADAVAQADERTRLILQLGRFAGLRRAEIAAVHTHNVDDGGWLTIAGKGGDVRRVPLHPVVLGQLRAAPAGWLFPAPWGHLSPDHVGRLASAALPAGWTLHTCRHRAGTDWYSIGRDIRAVQQLLGHASVATTQRYVQVEDQTLVAAVMGVAS